MSRRSIGASLAIWWPALPAVALLAVLQLPAVGGWFTRDDPCLLASVARHGIAAHWLDAQVWRSLSSHLFMPWQLLSLGLDWHVAGLAAWPYYLHHLLAFAALLLAGHAVLHRPLGPAWSGYGLLLFTASLPAWAVGQQLMNRHYVEGAVLALLAAVLYRRSLGAGHHGLAWAGAFLYLLAAAAKEIFVPLPLVLPLLPGHRTAGRWRALLPFALAAAGYAAWRLAMLGPKSLLARYGTASPPSAWGEGLERLAGGVGTTPLGLVALGALAATAVVVAARGRRGAWLLVGAIVLALAAPLAAVFPDLAPRHLFLPVLVGCGVVAAALGRLASTGGAPRAAAVASATLLLAGSLWSLATAPFVRAWPLARDQHRAEGRFVLHGPSGSLLLSTLADATFLGCLQELRQEYEPLPGPGYCADPCWCGSRYPDLPSWRWDAATRSVLPVARATPRCDVRAGQLDVAIDYTPADGQLHWQLGPHEEGEYDVLLVRGLDPPAVGAPVRLPREGSLVWPQAQPQGIIVRYESPAGWRSYSDPLELSRPGGDAATHLRWPEDGVR